mmetsp:Transcript_243/g.711  ORF Transcript_243/g.711 Transcript_243/m.711 type:complete len:286 (-) Transcript_243:171-1028(-)
MNTGHYLTISKSATHRVGTTRESLSEESNIGTSTVPLLGENAASTAEASLNLIGDQKDVVLLAESMTLGEVVLLRYDHTTLTLDRLNDETRDVLVMLFEDALQSLNVVVRNVMNVRNKRTETLTALRIVAQRYRSQCATMEATLGTDNSSTSFFDALLHVAPLASNLETSFDSLSTGVHWKHHIIAKHLSDALGKLRKLVIVEGTRAQRALGGLLHERLDDLRMAMSLVHSRVGGEEIIVVLSFRVPNVSTLSARKHHRDGVVVVSTMLVLHSHQHLRGERRRGS